jgi:hypothetical protein
MKRKPKAPPKGGFDFLGFRISRKPTNPRLNQATDPKTVFTPPPSGGRGASQKGIDKIKETISEVIVKDSPVERIISDLNPVLRG